MGQLHQHNISYLLSPHFYLNLKRGDIMNHILPRLILYSDLGRGSILCQLADLFRDWERQRSQERGWSIDRDTLIRGIHRQVKRLLDLATDCGFDENLWQCYLTWVLMTNENSFTRTCERTGAAEGSVNHFAIQDFDMFRRLFHYDFSAIEQDLGIDCFSTLCHYQAIPKRERTYNRDVSAQVRALRRQLDRAGDGREMFTVMTDYYRRDGYWNGAVWLPYQ